MNQEHDNHVGTPEWQYVAAPNDALRALRGLYEEHEYAATVRGCNKLLQKEPKNRSAKKLKKMAKARLLGHDMKVGVAVLCSTLLVSVGAMAFVNKKVLYELQMKDFQVNSLIEELGDVREENLILYDAFGNVREGVVELEKRMEDVDGIGGMIQLQEQLDQANQLLSAQEGVVDDLLEAGSELATLVEEDETLDILILGTHGRLTDTIMVASVNEATGKMNLFSIPRDLAVNGRRINEYYYRYGIDSMRDQIKEITGLYPEKYVVIDLAAFEDIVNILGGIDVYVEEDLYDSLYPGPNYTYETFYVEAGQHHFDGVTALKYARSRKSTNDFDRAKRQQQIIEAVRDKFDELNLLSNADELVNMYNSVVGSLDTDVDLISFISYLNEYNDYEITQGHVFSTGNYLYSTFNVSGAYILLPNAGNYGEIQQYVADIVKE